MKNFSSLSAICLTILGLCSSAPAALINFDDLLASPVPDGYGTIPGQVVVSYRTANNDVGFTTASPSVAFWISTGIPNGYGDLSKNAYPAINGKFGEITFTPQSGSQITLNGFDLAGFPATGTAATLTEAVISILHDSTSLELGPFNVTRVTHDHFSPAITSSGPITIRFGTDFNVGIDNIDFTVVPVPEAPTYLSAIFLLAVAVFRLFDWKSGKQRTGVVPLLPSSE
jgi:hypothetical protein